LETFHCQIISVGVRGKPYASESGSSPDIACYKH